MTSIRPAFLAALGALALLAPAPAAAAADEAAAVRTLLDAGDLDAAMKRVEQAANASPNDAHLRFLRGVVLMDQRRDAAALEVFTRMSQDYPELPDPFNNIALLRVRSGEFELARQALESALRNDPGHRLARANLGRVHLLLAVQAWELLSAQGPLELSLQQQLDRTRALLASPALPAR